MPSADRRSRRDVLRAAIGAATACASLPSGALGGGPRNAERCRAVVRRCLENVLRYGTDRYGPRHTPMFMSVIDVRTNDAPREPELLEAMVRTEERPGRRNPGGCDLWDDMPLLRTLFAFTRLTGERRWARAAEASIGAHLAFPPTEHGLIPWGSHLYIDATTEQIADDRHGRVHEILIHLPLWDRLWAIDREATRREIEGIWRWHICDKTTGQHNRHDDGQPGCDFAFSGGSFVVAFAFLHQKTREPVWLERAKLVTDWHWRHRNPETGLTVDAPSTGDRYDAHHFFTTISGPHCAQLLRAYELTCEPFFRGVAVTYLEAYLRYGWDEEAGRFRAGLRTDGTPVPEQAKGPGYDAWFPTGHIDLWPTTMYSYEFALATAQSYLVAWELTKRPALLDGARKWVRNLRAEMPPDIGRRWRKEATALLPAGAPRGAYADGYGRAISFLVGLHRATGEADHLRLAEELADEAMEKLVENGWVKGHPAKPTFEATDGVGTLLYALLELSALPRRLPPNL